MNWRELARNPLISPILVGVILTGYQTWHDQKSADRIKLDSLPDKEWMVDHFASKEDVSQVSMKAARLERQVDALDSRQRGLIQSMQIVCTKQDSACPIRNAVFKYPPIPPWPDQMALPRLVVHDKRRDSKPRPS